MLPGGGVHFECIDYLLVNFKGLVLFCQTSGDFFAFHLIFGLILRFSAHQILIFILVHSAQKQVLLLMCALRIAAQGDAGQQ